MADIEFTHDVGEDRGETPESGSLSKFAQVMGAGISLALLVGVGVWGYKLMVRDVSGIPVVRALDGPMRIQPENPGGRLADHQGLAVNAVAADGSAAKPADRLVLAPRPVGLSDEDAPVSEMIRPAARPEPAPIEPENPQVTPASAPSDESVAQSEQAAEIEALVAQITAGVEPLSEATEDNDTKNNPVIVETAALVEDADISEPTVARDVPGVAVSLRPQIRPEGGVGRGAETDVVTRATTSTLDIDPGDVPVGTRVVQLGAFESAEIAQSEWERLADQFGDYMGDKRRIVQEASSGGRTFFRLRAHGFEDLSDARRFCSVLVAEGADCIPVVTR